MEFKDLLAARHSTRGFDGRSLTKDQLRELVSAGTMAPNACNLQSWHFYAACGREIIDGLYPDVYGREWIKTAGGVIAVCAEEGELCDRFGERARSLFILQDTAAAAALILCRAADMGLSGCFVGAFSEFECRRYFDIPDCRRPVALLPVGYESDGEAPVKIRKSLDEVLTIIE